MSSDKNTKTLKMISTVKLNFFIKFLYKNVLTKKKIKLSL